MNTLVTGTPGSGKTTLVTYAQQIGDYRYFDSDEIDGLCEWREFETGTVLGLVSEYQATGDAWYKKYGWYWNTEILRQFLNEKANVVLCGSSENVVDCYKYFDKVVILKKTEQELVSNLQSSERTNPFGKTPEQRKNFLNWQDYLIKEAEEYNPIIVEGNDIKTVYELINNQK